MALVGLAGVGNAITLLFWRYFGVTLYLWAEADPRLSLLGDCDFFSLSRIATFLPEFLEKTELFTPQFLVSLFRASIYYNMITAETTDEPLHGTVYPLTHTIDMASVLISPVLDLPQIYTKPSGTDILRALDLLTIKPRSFATTPHEAAKGRSVQSAGITRYLTSIISSPLSWLESDELREAVWDAAGARLSERSGRAGI